MQTNKSITIREIIARERALKEGNSPDAGNLYSIVIDSIENGKSTVKEDACRFFQNCINKTNANTYTGECISLLKEFKDNQSILPTLENTFARQIVPYIEKLEQLKERVNSIELAESTKTAILEAVKINKICDRIVANDIKLSKRFDFDKYIRENAYKNPQETVLKCCEMIDTYNTPSYAKLNIALEELSYIYQKNHIDNLPDSWVEICTEYFYNTSTEEGILENFRSVLSENMCINASDIEDIKFMLEDGDETLGDKAHKIFDEFRLKEQKTVDDFKNMLNRLSEEEVNYQIDILFEVYDWFIHFGVEIFDDPVYEILETYIKYLVEEAKKTSLAMANKLITTIKSIEGIIRTYNEWEDKYYRLYNIFSVADEDLEIFADTRMTLSESAIKDKLLSKAADVAMSLKNYKVFKFQNLIRYAHDISKKLGKKEAKLRDKIKDKTIHIFNSAKDWLNEDYDISLAESENIIDCISEAGYFDHVLAIYEITNPAYISDVAKAFDEFCTENSDPDHDMMVYYTNVDNLIEVHVCDMTSIALNEQENDEWMHTFTESEQAYLGYMADTIEKFALYDSLNIDSFREDFAQIEKTLTAEGILGVIEASKYLMDMLPLGRLQEIASNYADEHPSDYMGNTAISQALDNWKLEESNFDMVIDTLSLLREAIDESLLKEDKINTKVDTSINKKNDDKKQDEKEKVSIKDKLSQAKDNAKENIEKAEKTKINFNSLKYAMEDLKLKSKNAGDKATQFTNTLNIYVQKFIEAVRKLYTNDDREQIIRGSVIPSFHQLMGRLLVIGVIGTGVGVFYTASMGIFAAVLSTFVTIALSKHSTDKERALMLDELAIEMDVCDKEMQKAEANGNLKKYRALSYRLTKLKREYQRIRYGIGYKEYKKNPVVDVKKNG